MSLETGSRRRLVLRLEREICDDKFVNAHIESWAMAHNLHLVECEAYGNTADVFHYDVRSM
jgi:hypothetical protein